MRMSASSLNPAVVDVRKSFGFMPAEKEGVVIYWPVSPFQVKQSATWLFV
jgi:hypothetical protein